MPLYEFECEHCSTKKEMTIPLADIDQTILCSECNKPLKRLIGQGNFILKGTGWFKDGYSNPESNE